MRSLLSVKAAKVPHVGRMFLPRKIDSVGVIGGGTIGSSIAINFLSAGIPVTMIEVAQGVWIVDLRPLLTVIRAP